MKKIQFFFVAAIVSNQLLAVDLTVSAFNKTRNIPARYAEKVTVIKLNESMQAVSVKTDIALPVIFNNLPEMNEVPYMVQVTHGGVNYNKMIPPMSSGKVIEANIDIYDTTNVFPPEMRLEEYIEIHYFKNVLTTDITYHFTNPGNYTFSERGSKAGILMYVSEEGKNVEGQASMDSQNSSSDIKTLKLNPAPLAGKPDYYLLEQPVKPGEKYFQARVHYKYNGDPLEIVLENIYPMVTKPMIIVYPKDMLIKWKENPQWDTKAIFNEELGANTLTMPNQPGKFTLVFSGGIPEVDNNPGSSSGNQRIEAASPVHKYVKLGGVLVFIVVVSGFFYYLRQRPEWLQMIQAKNKSRLNFEMQNLQSLNLPPKILEKREKQIKEKLKGMEKLFKI